MRRFIRAAAAGAALFASLAVAVPAASAADSTSQLKPMQQTQAWTLYARYAFYSECVRDADIAFVLGADTWCILEDFLNGDGSVSTGYSLYLDWP